MTLGQHFEIEEAQRKIGEQVKKLQKVAERIKDTDPRAAMYIGFAIDDLTGSVAENLTAALAGGDGYAAFRSVAEE